MISIPLVVILTYIDPSKDRKDFLSYDDVQNFFDDERVSSGTFTDFTKILET